MYNPTIQNPERGWPGAPSVGSKGGVLSSCGNSPLLCVPKDGAPGKEIGVDCDFEARGETVEEILVECAELGRDIGGMNGPLFRDGRLSVCLHPERVGTIQRERRTRALLLM